MQLLDRRRSAILLIVLGLALLGFGIWIIVSMFIKGPSTQPVENTTYRKPEPRTIALPVKVTGTSTTPVTQTSDERDALNKAAAVVSRMGSGTSADGFLGYSDVMIDGTESFKAQMASEQKSLQRAHAASGPLFGITTRVISSDISQGKNGDTHFVVTIKAQRTEDGGDRGQPTRVAYIEYSVSLVKQGGSLLVDSVTEKSINQ